MSGHKRKGTKRTSRPASKNPVDAAGKAAATPSASPGPTRQEPADTKPGLTLRRLDVRRQAIVYLLFGIVSLAFFDLFGLEETSRLALQDRFNQVFAGRYRAFSPTHDAKPRPAEVAVVLWDDNDLTRSRLQWPLSYWEHAKALRRVLKEKPRAVFIDVLFLDSRGETRAAHERAIKPLREAISRLTEAHIRVYLVNAGGCSDEGVVPSLLEPTPYRPSRREYVRPRTVPAPRRDEIIDGVTREYVLFADKLARHSSENLVPECATAALRVHLDELRVEHRRTTAAPRARAYDLADYWHPMILFWGGCDDDGPGLLRRITWWLSGRDQRRPPTCVPFDVVGVGALSADGPRNFSLKDKLVVYGTNFRAAADRVTTAIHDGRVPGPVVHAMALDNLQRWRTHYLRRIPASAATTFELRLTWLDLGMLLVGALVFPLAHWLLHEGYVRERARRLMPTRESNVLMVRWIRVALAVFVTFAFGILAPFAMAGGVGMLFFLICGLAPVNFAAHAFVWIFVEQVLAAYELLTDAPKSDHAATGGTPS